MAYKREVSFIPGQGAVIAVIVYGPSTDAPAAFALLTGIVGSTGNECVPSIRIADPDPQRFPEGIIDLAHLVLSFVQVLCPGLYTVTDKTRIGFSGNPYRFTQLTCALLERKLLTIAGITSASRIMWASSDFSNALR